MSRFDLLICDWAGTTVDFGSFAPIEALDLAFQSVEINATDEEIRQPMGMTKIDHIRTMFSMPRIEEEWFNKHQKSADDDDIAQVYNLFKQKILVALNDPQYAKPKPGVLQGIKQIKNSGLKIGSTTGYTKEMMAELIPNAKEQGLIIDSYKTSEDVSNFGRPYPYMIFANMQEFGVQDVNRVIKIGDTLADIKEGQNAGVFTAAVLEGSSEMGLRETEYENLNINEQNELKNKLRNKFLEAGADKVFDNFEEFTHFILNN